MRGWLASPYPRSRQTWPPKMQNKHNQGGIEAGHQIVQHDSKPQRDPFNITDGKRFHNIEESKKQESYQQQEKSRVPEYQPKSQQLSHDLIDHNLRRILPPKEHFSARCRPDSSSTDGRDHDKKQQ